MWPMWRLTFTFLIASILSVRGLDLGVVIGNITSAVNIYDAELDNAVPFRELRASLDVLDSLATNYRGNLRRDIAEAFRIGYLASENYYIAIELVFNWCVKAELICDVIIDRDSIEARADLLELTKDMLIKGLREMNTSLKLLGNTRRQLTDMRGKLAPVPSALQSELLGVRDDYSRKRRDRLRALEEKQRKVSNKRAIAIASGVALALLGPIPMIFGAGAIIYGGTRQDPTLNGQEEATKARELKIMETFLTALENAVQVTIDRITAVKESVNREITMDHELLGLTDGRKNIIEYFGTFPFGEVEKLKKSVKRFLGRHGGTLRQKREALRDVLPLKWSAISLSVDRMLDATALERERDYWTLYTTDGALARFL